MILKGKDKQLCSFTPVLKCLQPKETKVNDTDYYAISGYFSSSCAKKSCEMSHHLIKKTKNKNTGKYNN
jgi:hypothetical protein